VLEAFAGTCPSLYGAVELGRSVVCVEKSPEFKNLFLETLNKAKAKFTPAVKRDGKVVPVSIDETITDSSNDSQSASNGESEDATPAPKTNMEPTVRSGGFVSMPSTTNETNQPSEPSNQSGFQNFESTVGHPGQGSFVNRPSTPDQATKANEQLESSPSELLTQAIEPSNQSGFLFAESPADNELPPISDEESVGAYEPLAASKNQEPSAISKLKTKRRRLEAHEMRKKNNPFVYQKSTSSTSDKPEKEIDVSAKSKLQTKRSLLQPQERRNRNSFY
jgi:hypothetical protein